MPTTSNPILAEAPWVDAYPLSISELNRLARLRLRIDAKEFLARRFEFVEPAEAARLAFCKWLVATGRLTEEVDS